MAFHHLRKEIEIDASPERVWAVLTDFSSHPQWNPFIRSIAGVPEQAPSFTWLSSPIGAESSTSPPIVQIADSGRELRWLGRFILPGVFDGEHRLAIVPLAKGKVRFQQSGQFRRLLVDLLRNGLNQATKRGFEQMNSALKALVESTAKQA